MPDMQKDVFGPGLGRVGENTEVPKMWLPAGVATPSSQGFLC